VAPGAPAGTTREVYDEAFSAPGRARPPYEEILAAIADADLDELTTTVDELLRKRDVTFGGADGEPFTVDPIPRVLTGEEWRRLAAGLEQRVRALDAFVADVYGERRCVAARVIPERVITGSVYFEEDLVGAAPAGGAWISIAGLDLVRGADGRFVVLEDNVRTPSGIAYAMAASDAVADVIPLPRRRAHVHAQLRSAMRGALEAARPDADGELVLLTDGQENSAWYEHQRLARLADLELVRPHDLRRRGDRLELADGRPVRSVYRRTDEDRLRDETGALTDVGALLLEPLLAGTIGLVNWFGTGIADDKHVYAYVDDLVRFHLGEEPLVPSVPTFDLSDDRTREACLDRLDELVVKPRGGHGGDGVLVGPTASRAELARAAEAIRRDPDDWIAQETVSLSTHPTVVDGRLAPRHVDLRPFVFFDGERAVVPPGGLTRVALEQGSMVVNSSRKGGGKSTWVVD
jgi:uncharacterized circularly permuted ATP-grasp superfamily protein